MPGGILRHMLIFNRNLVRHLHCVLRRRQTFAEAKAQVKRDAQKLARRAGIGAPPEGNRRKAVHLSRQGRHAYNTRQYSEAEKLFEQAADADPTYALAYTYLGHSLYKQGRQKEAEAAWQKASDVEPDSAAASKARKKLQHSARATSRTVDSLIERLKE
jgi:tetratricopeptide (TPR) repeat protein